MPLHIALNEKFACYAFTHFAIADDVPEEIQLAPRLWAIRKVDIDIADDWQKWIGSIKTEALDDSNFALYTTAPSAKPDIFDEENIGLAETLGYLLYGILLHGVPYYEQSFSLNGAHVGGEFNIRQFGSLKDYSPSVGLDFYVRLGTLKRSAWLVDRLQMVNTGGAANWARLRRGLRALFIGSLTPNDDGDRLHQLVRAIEALVKPEMGKTRKQFAHRVTQTFTVADDETRETLLQLFDMRSHVEHMHHVVDVLEEGDETARIAVVNRRTRQVDVLARHVLLRVMGSDPPLEVFRTDARIQDFWSMSDADRQAAWGPRLDIRAVG